MSQGPAIFQRDFESRVRVGVVGAGEHAYKNILPVLTFLPANLVAVADVNRDVAERTARQYGLHGYGSAAEMYEQEELEAVLLCVSAQLHPRLAVEAFEAGLHVWMEKPAGVTVADVDFIIAARGDRIVSVGYKKAFMPATRKVEELVESGVLGKIRTVLGVYPMSIPRADQTSINEKQPSTWLANGSHPLAFFLSVAGPVASLAVHRAEDDSGVLVMRHNSGVISNFHLALGAPSSQPCERYSIFGDAGSIEVENSRRVKFQRGIPSEYPRTTSFAPAGLNAGAISWEAQDSFNTLECRSEFTQGLYGGLEHFLTCVLEKTPSSRGNLEFARQLSQIYEAAMLSNNRTIALEAVDGIR